jgi:hypothetical protein
LIGPFTNFCCCILNLSAGGIIKNGREILFQVRIYVTTLSLAIMLIARAQNGTGCSSCC